jgi:HD-like signal output (HDOD) protein
MSHTTGLPPQRWEELPETVQQHWQPLVASVNLPPLFMETARGHLDPGTYDPQQIASLAERDPVLGARLLAIANSASFGLIQPISSIQRAVVHMGMRLVESVILSYNMEATFSQVPAFPRLHLEYARTWAAASSVLAQHIAAGADGLDPGTVATGALLSRLGVLLLGLAQPRPGETYLAQPNMLARLRLEGAEWGVGAALLSWRLLKEWQLPDPLPDWARRCDEPLCAELAEDGAAGKTLAVIAAANALSAHYIADRTMIPALVLEEPAYGVLLGNLRQYDLYGAATEVFNRKVARRELEGACMAG